MPIPPIFAANESKVLINGNAVDGVRSLEYARRQARENLYAMGSRRADRGGLRRQRRCEGRLRVLSTSPTLDALDRRRSFQISAQLKHGRQPDGDLRRVLPGRQEPRAERGRAGRGRLLVHRHPGDREGEVAG